MTTLIKRSDLPRITTFEKSPKNLNLRRSASFSNRDDKMCVSSDGNPKMISTVSRQDLTPSVVQSGQEVTTQAHPTRQEMTSTNMSVSSGLPSSLQSSRVSSTSRLSGRSSRNTPRSSDETPREWKRVPYRQASNRSLLSISNGPYVSREAGISNNIDTHKAVPEVLEIFYERCDGIQNTVIQNIKRVQQTHAAVLADIKKFRKQIDNVLDVWEQNAVTKANDIMETDMAHLRSVMEESEKIAKEIQECDEEVTEYKRKLIEVNVIETEAKNTFREYKFVGNCNISDLLKAEQDIGTIQITHEVAGLYNNLREFESFIPTYLEEINVKSDSDTFDCDITGMAIVGPHKLVVADADNRSIKCIDTKLRKITSQLPVPAGPWDLTVVHRGQLAVTVPRERLIQFVQTTGGLIEDRHIKVQGECHGIAYRRRCLIVSFRWPGRVQIMTLQGLVLKSIKLDPDQNKLFKWPDYVAISRDGSSIYVSDWHRNTLTRLSWKGEVTGTHKDDAGTKMAGVAVGLDGCVYVCKRTSHSIVKLSPDLEVATTVLEEKHGLKFPWSMCFCELEHKLYVDNNRNSNTIAVFELR